MKRLLIITALLLSAGPAFAGHTATAAQWRDIRKLQHVFAQCGGTDADEWYDPQIKKACALSRELQEKLGAQGFCFYRRILPGKPAKDKGSCEPLTNLPLQ
jgi:hypothetical protein